MTDEHINECPQREDVNAECKCEVNGVFCRCIICRVSFTKAEAWNNGRCPECGTNFVPMHPSSNVEVKVHWRELQTLAVWAEHYAAAFAEQYPDMQRALYAITHELEIQHPFHSPLTIGRELGIMIEKGSFVTKQGNIEPVLPKARLQ